MLEKINLLKIQEVSRTLLSAAGPSMPITLFVGLFGLLRVRVEGNASGVR